MQHQPDVVLGDKDGIELVPTPLHKGSCPFMVYSAILSKTYIQQCHLRVILPEHKQHEVAGTVQEAQSCGQLAAGKAVQGQMHLWMGSW